MWKRNLKQIKIDSLISFINQIFKIKQEKTYYIFRGQTNDDWGLVPKIARDKNNNIAPFINKKTSENREKEVQKHINMRFPAYGFDFSTIANKNERYWRTMFLAQHYGIPTRLLDFSRNPIVALYFAVNEGIKNDGAIWGISVEMEEWIPFNRLIDEYDSVEKVDAPLEPAHINERIIVQNSVLYCYPDIGISLDQYIIKKKPKKKIIKFVIDKNEKEKIRRELHTIGIHDVTLFPDIEGFSKFIRWRIEEPLLSHDFT